MSAINEGDYRRSNYRTVLSRGRRYVNRRRSPHLFKETYAARHLASRNASIYLEIGVRFGDSFRPMKADTKVAIDPVRTEAMSELQPGSLFFQCNSDDFFSDHAPSVLAKGSVDVALVDGLHTFAQTYRDVFNLKRYMSPDGLVILDDCNPPNAERASPKPVEGLWNGDVWKIFPLLNSIIDEDHLYTIDADQGIGIIRNFTGDWPLPTSDAFALADALTYSDLAQDRSSLLRLRQPKRTSPINS